MCPSVRITVESENGKHKSVHIISERAATNLATDVYLCHLLPGTGRSELDQTDQDAVGKLGVAIASARKNEP